jgi:phosphoribosylformylglycinamidine synthase
VTDCLNFGNPEKPDVYYQLERCISGMAEACRVLDTPVISGNVSLYNETNGEAIYPTPVVGVLGVLEDVRYRLEMGFRNDGDLVYLLGVSATDGALPGEAAALGGSEYLASIGGRVAGRPRIDLDLERRVQRVCLRAARAGLLSAAHDCADGGLAVALAECCIAGGVGLDASDARLGGRTDAALFGEAQSRIVVAVPPPTLDALLAIAGDERVPCVALGRVGGERLRLAGVLDLPIDALAAAYEAGIPETIGIALAV